MKYKNNIINKRKALILIYRTIILILRLLVILKDLIVFILALLISMPDLFEILFFELDQEYNMKIVLRFF